jgi:NAD(P)-dependent dehydrogenase (short-subunit alcohol dehydrogenase family)
MARMHGKVALITGAAGGIGRAAARLFAAEGAAVLLADIDEAGLAGSAEGLERAATVKADVSLPEDNARLVAEAERRFGGLDAVLLNAALEGPIMRFADYPLETFDRLIAVNLRGVFLGIQAAIPALRRRGGGSIVITSSTSGVRGLPGVPGYTASKHAAIGLARSAAVDLGPENIRVNAVCPGPTDTRMMRSRSQWTQPDDPAAAAEAFRLATPIKRFAAPEEIARLMLFLASDEASYCTGGVYMADGGQTAGPARP